MFNKSWKLTAIGLLSFSPLLTSAELIGPVGPTVSIEEKAKNKICNVLDYGAKADNKTDLGPALQKAWDDCRSGGLTFIPDGPYAMETFVLLEKGDSTGVKLDGQIYRTGTGGGNMIHIKRSKDVEFFSSTQKGAIQGFGYELRNDGESGGPRLLRFTMVENFSVHDISLVDSPAFHLSADTCQNGELYNIVIHAGSQGGLDGIDVWGDNLYVHNVEVSNKDECVNVKNPSHNILVEDVYCNNSGGCAMGSLATETNITDITYRNVYSVNSNQMYMFKSNGGDGFVRNVLLENFIGHGNAYAFNLETAWNSMDPVPGDGILYQNITVSNWTGTVGDGQQRAPLRVHCPEKVPCREIFVQDFNMWTDTDDSSIYHECRNSYGKGYCLNPTKSYGSFEKTETITETPNYSAPTMPADLETGFPLNETIPLPTIPSVFFPSPTSTL